MERSQPGVLLLDPAAQSRYATAVARRVSRHFAQRNGGISAFHTIQPGTRRRIVTKCMPVAYLPNTLVWYTATGISRRGPQLNIEEERKGKPIERWGRKTTGPTTDSMSGEDSRVAVLDADWAARLAKESGCCSLQGMIHHER